MARICTNASYPSFVMRMDTKGREGGEGPGPEPGPELVWSALLPDLVTYKMLGVRDGAGAVANARVAVINLSDFEQIYREQPGGQPGYESGRVVGAQVFASDAGGSPLAEMPWAIHAPEATNYFLNAQSPVTQVISGLSGTSHCSMVGTGSVVLSGGATGTATEGNSVQFDAAGADVTFTVAGATFVQVETGLGITPPIYTVGSALVRDTDEISWSNKSNWTDKSGHFSCEVILPMTACAIFGGFLVWDGTKITLVAGANNQSLPTTPGEHRIEVWWDAAGGEMRLKVDDTLNTPSLYSGLIVPTDPLRAFDGCLEVAKLRNLQMSTADVNTFPPGAIHRWDFTVGSGTTLPDLIGGLDGTLVGNASWETGGGLHISGTGSGVYLGLILPEQAISGMPTGKITVVAKVSQESHNATRYMLFVAQRDSAIGGYASAMMITSRMYLLSGGSGVYKDVPGSGDGTKVLGFYFHSADTGAFVVDGQVFERTGVPPINSISASGYIGCRNLDGSLANPFMATFHEMAVWDRELTQAEHREIARLWSF